MPPHNALTETERKIALWLARGKTSPVIASEMGIAVSTLRVHLSRIRTKTSLSELSPARLTSYLERNAIAAPCAVRSVITDTQRTVLLMVASNRTVDDIATALGINRGTVMNHASQGCKRLGITAQGFARRQAILDALIKLDPMNDPAFQL